MTDPKEVAAYVARCREMSEDGKYTWWSGLATALQSISSELERVKGERDLALRTIHASPKRMSLLASEIEAVLATARAERAEASLGVAVKALASAADAAKSFRDESGDAVAEQVLLRISPALASIQAKGE
jgi:hypothetical protein